MTDVLEFVFSPDIIPSGLTGLKALAKLFSDYNHTSTIPLPAARSPVTENFFFVWGGVEWGVIIMIIMDI